MIGDSLLTDARAICHDLRCRRRRLGAALERDICAHEDDGGANDTKRNAQRILDNGLILSHELVSKWIP